jgi:hypothetical protein
MPPRARTTGLVTRELGGELVVFDQQSCRAHCLNRTAALVFRLADGRRTAADLAEGVAEQAGSHADLALVHDSLAQLRAAGLLEEGDPTTGGRPAPFEPAPCSSRREVLKSVALGASVAAPLVLSLLVPSPAEAAATCVASTSCQSGVNDGSPCYVGNPSTECTLLTCQGTGVCSP